MGFKNLLGQRFGRLIVIERAENNKYGQAMWICKCDCGNITKPIQGQNLRNGNTQSCGCYNKKRISETNASNLIGKRFGRLVVKEKVGSNSNKKTVWLCECDCGNIKTIVAGDLTSGRTLSCGCLHKEQLRGSNNHKYNPNLTKEEREQQRHIEGYSIWSYEVKKQANFVCDVCNSNKSGTLVSHHLDGYHWDKEHRLDINNGVCLCESCHKEFHHIYGYGDNTKQQYIEFKDSKKKGDDN